MQQLTMVEGDAALIFRESGDLDMILPRPSSPDAPLSATGLCAMFVEEFLRDGEMIKQIRDRLVKAGKISEIVP